MATVRVSFLLGGERFHGRLSSCSVLSDVPAKATRVNRAGPGYKVIRLRRLSHARQYGTDQAVFLRRRTGGSHFPFAFSTQVAARGGLAIAEPSEMMPIRRKWSDWERRGMSFKAIDGDGRACARAGRPSGLPGKACCVRSPKACRIPGS